MGGLVKKRHRSIYDQVDSDIQFAKRPRLASPVVAPTPTVAATKRQPQRRLRTRRNSYEDNDESSTDSVDMFKPRETERGNADTEISFNLTRLAKKVEFNTNKYVINKETSDTCDQNKNPRNPIKKNPPAVTCTVNQCKLTGAAAKVGCGGDEEDTREMNRRSPNGFLLPDPLPRGERLQDSVKGEWVLGKAIGVGGFGELYLAAAATNGKLSNEDYVIKIEPHSNGPLFVEVHFYIRATKPEQLDQFRRDHGIKHLGVPRYIASGTHVAGGQKYRFLVMERFGSDLQRILDNSEGGRLTDKTVCEVGLQLVDSLQYIHHQGYVHKDVKASNLLVGLGVNGQHKVHLVDYGLCSRFTIGGLHKQYTHDLRWAHEGTLEYTSRDSHIGCTSRRGDIEVLLYNLIEWWGGILPWDREFASPQIAKVAKFRAFANPLKFLRYCFRGNGGKHPALLLKLMRYISGLRFEDAPDYAFLRNLFKQEMRTLGLRADGRLEFRLGTFSPQDDTDANCSYLRPNEDPWARVSAVFDKLCVSERSWEAERENIWADRDVNSLDNPTQAMKDVMKLIKQKEQEKKTQAGARKRTKSGNYMGEGSENTPAMLEVLRIKKLRDLEEEPPSDEAALLPTSILRISPIPSEVVLAPSAPLNTGSRRLKVRSKELSRLDSFLADPEPDYRRRTRSADVVTDMEAGRNLRSALRQGFGNVKTLFRQVSDSFTSLF